MRPMRFGLIGTAGAGKDTLANAMVALGYSKLELKWRIHELLMIASAPYAEAVNEMGYEAAKRTLPWVRPLMIDTAEFMKKRFSDSIFVDPVLAEARSLPNVVVSDVRFQVEARLLHAEGFRFLRIVRPCATMADEQGALHWLWDQGIYVPEIHNTGTEQDLKDQAKQFRPFDLG